MFLYVFCSTIAFFEEQPFCIFNQLALLRFKIEAKYTKVLIFSGLDDYPLSLPSGNFFTNRNNLLAMYSKFFATQKWLYRPYSGP